MRSIKPLCLNCNKPVSRRPKIYCNNVCQHEHTLNVYITKWKAGEIDATSGYGVSHHIRRYLLKKHNNSCELCGWSKINSTTGKFPLEIHHIDGSYKNSKENNLQLLCPNCHSLTSNSGVLNVGNGRRFKRIKLGDYISGR